MGAVKCVVLRTVLISVSAKRPPYTGWCRRPCHQLWLIFTVRQLVFCQSGRKLFTSVTPQQLPASAGAVYRGFTSTSTCISSAGHWNPSPKFTSGWCVITGLARPHARKAKTISQSKFLSILKNSFASKWSIRIAVLSGETEKIPFLFYLGTNIWEQLLILLILFLFYWNNFYADPALGHLSLQLSRKGTDKLKGARRKC